jgi:hypothetical protein
MLSRIAVARIADCRHQTTAMLSPVRACDDWPLARCLLLEGRWPDAEFPFGRLRHSSTEAHKESGMKRTLLTAVAIAALLPAAGAALANDKGKTGGAGASFDRLDTNGDGRISRSEASADSNLVFARVDTNGDGYIDATEFAKASQDRNSDSSTPPQPQSSAPSNDASGQTEPVTPQDESTTPPTDTETPRQ